MSKPSSSNRALCQALLLIAAIMFQGLALPGRNVVFAKAPDPEMKKAPNSQPGMQPKQSAATAQPQKTPAAPNAPLAAVLSATNRDSFPNHGDGKAHEADVITYSVAITNSGDANATTVNYANTVDINTSTLVGGSPTIQFTVTGDTYAAIGNVRIDTATITPGSGQTVLENDTVGGAALTGFGSTLAVANGTVPNGVNTVTTANGGTVTMNADGSFKYSPAAGFTGADSYWYTLTKNSVGTGNPTGFPSGSARVTINVSAPIWFVKTGAAGGGDGRLATPFNCLTGAGCFSAVNDGVGLHPAAGHFIFLYGTVPPAALTGGVTLLNNQKLIGEGATASLATIAGVSVPAGSDPLPATGNVPPVITTVAAATNGVNLAVAASATLRGFTIGNTTGFKIASGASFGTLTTSELLLNGSGGALTLTSGVLAATFTSITSTSSSTQGINLSGLSGSMTITGGTTISGNTTQCILTGTTTADINFGNTSCTGGTDGLSFQNNANVGHLLTFGTLSATGGTGNAFLHGAGGGNVTVTGAATLSSNGSAVLVSAPTSTNVINFQAATSAASLTAAATGVNWAGTAGATITFNSLTVQTNAGTGLQAQIGGTVNVTTGTGTINNTTQAAAAIIGNAVALNANFASINSSGGTNGVSLTTVTGTSNFGTGALSGASGGTFLVNGSTGTVTFNGTITQGNAARVVDIQNKTGGTVALGGAISSTGGTGTGIILNSNTGATINFTGAISLTTNANAAFTATGGGTVSASNSTSTITTTTATAVNVANTTIGASNLRFVSITSNTASANSGIVLNNTGASGGLVVIGSGGACTSAGTCTGGSISNKTVDGVSLTSTFGTSLSNMNISSNGNTGAGASGIIGTTVTNLSIIACNLLTNGVNAGQHGINLTTVLGTSAITNTTISQSGVDNLHIDNTSGTLTLLTVSGCTFKDSRIPVQGNDGFLFLAHNAAIATILVNGANNFTNNLLGAQFQALDSSNVTVTIQGNTFTNSNSGLQVEANSSAHMIAHIGGTTNALGNTFTAPAVPLGSVSDAITASNFALSNAASDFNVKIEHNNVTIPTGGVNHGVVVFGSGTNAPLKALVDGNTITNNGQFDGIHVNTPDTGSTPIMDVTVTNNTVNSNDLLGASATISINCNYRRATTGTFKIEGNTTTSANGGNGIQLRRTLGTVRIERGVSASAVPSVVLAANNPLATGTGGNINVVTDGTITVVNNGTIIPPLLIFPGFEEQALVRTPTGSETAKTSLRADTSIAALANLPVTQRNSAASAPTAKLTHSVATESKAQVSPVATAIARMKTASLETAHNRSREVRSNHAVKRAASADKKPLSPDSGGTVNLPVGTITPGSTVVLTYQVTVNNTAPSGASTISNQGTVTSSIPSIVTDDPDTGAANDATITPLLHPTAANGVVSGRITDTSGKPVEGAVVNLSGGQARKLITDANGNYRFENVDTGGFYTVTPSRANYNFNPFNRSFSQTGNQTEAVFTAESMGDNANPLDTAEYFVRQQYVDILRREPDEAGFNYWSDQILACGDDASCTRAQRTGVAAAFFIENEAQLTGAFIYDVYAGTLGRRPVFGEYTADRGQVVGGDTLDTAKTIFAQNFVQRAEFVTKYQGAMTAESFVDALIQSAQSSGGNINGERESLISLYGQTADLVTSRAAVIRSLADNAAFKQSQYNKAFVLTEYFSYLLRDPEPEGLNFWVTVLTTGDAGNYRGMVCSFVSAAEYQNRFSQIVSHTNGECSGQ